MSTWTLSEIRQKVRQVTGRLTPDELSNNQIDNYINHYYQYTFPAEVKLDRKFTYYTFNTIGNQAYYDFPEGFTNFVPPAQIAYRSINWYQDPAMFYQQNPQLIAGPLPQWVGDGVTVTFTVSVVGFPIMPGTLLISDNAETFADTNKDWTTNNVTFTGSDGGTCTVNYDTGAISVTFVSAPISGVNIYLQYLLFNPGLPKAVLEYNNQFQFTPVPNTAYNFTVKAYKVVDPLINSTDRPPLDEWGPCIAYGAARDIQADFGELDAYAQTTALYKEQVDYIMTRTEQNLLNIRALPNY